MQAKELQLLDLVFYKGKVFRVISLDYIGGLVGIDNESDCYLVSENEIEPIPLIPEILKKNGFTEFGGVWDFPDKSQFGVMITTLHHKGIYPTFDESAYFLCGYVHELQHALRLCGLNDLADNIQV